jgi:hypothetical protein
MTHLMQKLLEDHKECHEIPCVAREDAIGVGPADVFGCCSHCGRNHLACGVHQTLSEPFEDFLNGLRVWLL